MTTTLKGVIALIKAEVVALKIGANPAFGTVLDYVDGDFTKFPTAVITEKGGDGEVIDTHRNQRTYQFEIKLYQEQSMKGKTKEEAAIIMRDSADAILTAFDQDKDLGGEVSIIRVVSFETNYIATAGTFNFATFNVDVVVLVNSF